MRAGVRVTASLALVMAVALPTATSATETGGMGEPKAVGGRVTVREIDRQRETEYRARFQRDNQPIDNRFYYGERRDADGLRREARNRRHHHSGSFIYLRSVDLGGTRTVPPPTDRAETDEFGNLVVYRASGYKQIIVGGAMVLRRAGVEAEDLFKPAPDSVPDYSDSPSVIYFDGSERRSDSGVVIVRPPVYD